MEWKKGLNELTFHRSVWFASLSLQIPTNCFYHKENVGQGRKAPPKGGSETQCQPSTSPQSKSKEVDKRTKEQKPEAPKPNHEQDTEYWNLLVTDRRLKVIWQTPRFMCLVQTSSMISLVNCARITYGVFMLVFDITSCGAHHSLCGATASGGPLNVFYPGTFYPDYLTYGESYDQWAVNWCNRI